MQCGRGFGAAEKRGKEEFFLDNLGQCSFARPGASQRRATWLMSAEKAKVSSSSAMLNGGSSAAGRARNGRMEGDDWLCGARFHSVAEEVADIADSR